MGVEKVDAVNGWLYFRASPENAGQRYLYRTRLSGEGKAESLTARARHPFLQHLAARRSGDSLFLILQPRARYRDCAPPGSHGRAHVD